MTFKWLVRLKSLNWVAKQQSVVEIFFLSLVSPFTEVMLHTMDVM